VDDEKNKDKLTADEKSDALAKVADMESWLSSNANADKEANSADHARTKPLFSE